MSMYLKILCVLIYLPLFGCASSPYLIVKGVYQHDRGSDWVLQPERKWINGSNNPRLHIQAGLEWENNLDCPYIASGTDQLRWVHLGCAKTFGSYDSNKRFNFFAQLDIVHQVDSLTSSILSTDMKAWSGHNPFWHFRGGLIWKKWKCPVIATGRSMFQGLPFESEDMAPDLYWTHVECGRRWGGK